MASKFLYRYIFKRTSTYALAVVISSIFFERIFDDVTERIFASINKGRLWPDIKDKYKDRAQDMRYKSQLKSIAKPVATKSVATEPIVAKPVETKQVVTEENSQKTSVENKKENDRYN